MVPALKLSRSALGGFGGPHFKIGEVKGKTIVIGGGASSGNSDADAAAVVGLASHSGCKLCCSVAREDQVAVRIDETRDDDTSGNVDPGIGGGSMSGSCGITTQSAR